MPKYKSKPRSIVIPIGPSIAYIPLTQGYFALIDADDVSISSLSSWYIQSRRKAIYAYCWKDGRNFPLHRLLCDRGEVVDHKNRETLDNRRCNLRPATASENALNSQRANKYGKGVRKLSNSTKRKNNFQAMIGVNGRVVALGVFPTAEAANAAYYEAASKLVGDFARG